MKFLFLENVTALWSRLFGGGAGGGEVRREEEEALLGRLLSRSRRVLRGELLLLRVAPLPAHRDGMLCALVAGLPDSCEEEEEKEETFLVSLRRVSK